MTKSQLRTFLFALCLAVLLSGCRSSLSDLTDAAAKQTIAASASQPSGEVQFEAITSIRIPYDPGDSLDPYSAKTTVNRFICQLLYDGLVRLSPDMHPENLLAESITPSVGNTVWTIKVAAGKTFPNNVTLNANDVVFSFKLAMAQNSVYQASLSKVSSVVKGDENTVLVTLVEPDRFFMNLLTFPIIEYGSAEEPSAIGRYSLSPDGGKLLCNSPSATIQDVILVDLGDHDMLLQETRIGVFDCIFLDDPLSSGTASLGGIEPVTMNNLVYLGINSHQGFVNSAKFRHALEYALDLEDISEDVYSGHAVPAASIFNPTHYEIGIKDRHLADLQNADTLLDELGYEARDEDGLRMFGGKRITLTLAVNSESSTKIALAKKIAEQLSRAGIYVELQKYPYEAYLAALESGAVDLYIAEVHLGANLDISPLFLPSEDEKIGFGTPESEELEAAWNLFQAGNSSFGEFNESFYAVTPFIPLLYREGYFVYSRAFYFDVEVSESDIFYNIMDWQ